jgi:hypothetical protein
MMVGDKILPEKREKKGTTGLVNSPPRKYKERETLRKAAMLKK